jgi:hypothetical protein
MPELTRNNLPKLIFNSVVSYHSHNKGKGVEYEEGEGKGESWPYVFEYTVHFMEHGHWATPCLSWLELPWNNYEFRLSKQWHCAISAYNSSIVRFGNVRSWFTEEGSFLLNIQ